MSLLELKNCPEHGEYPVEHYLDHCEKCFERDQAIWRAGVIGVPNVKETTSHKVKYKELPASETNTFLVGQKVKVYHGHHHIQGNVNNVSGEFVYVTEDGFYSAHSDSPFHFRQCRKLEAIQPKEFYIKITKRSNGQLDLLEVVPVNEAFNPKDKYIKVREVLPEEDEID